MIYQINPKLNIPIYRQLVDSIRTAIKKGELLPEQKLPTVQELSEQLGIARGTIKRVYDELELQGMVEKVQGRGTFVCYRPTEATGRKEQAMRAIDALLDELEEIGLSASETKIYLDLKLRERAERSAKVKVAVLECNPENLSRMAEQLREIAQIDVHSYLTESVESYPYKLAEGMDLIVTTVSHAGFVENLLPERKRLVRVALRLMPKCLSEIVKLPPNSSVGILCSSLRFGQLLQNTSQMYAEDVRLFSPEAFSSQLDLKAFLHDKDAVLLPTAYEKYCTKQDEELLRSFRGKLIPCSYEMDEGSFLYLQEKIKRLSEAKSV